MEVMKANKVFQQFRDSLDKPVYKQGRNGKGKLLYDMTGFDARTKKQIKDFIAEKNTSPEAQEGISCNYLRPLWYLYRYKGPFRFEDLKAADITGWLEQGGWSQNSRHHYWTRCMKIILLWMYESTDQPVPKWVKKLKIPKGAPRVSEETVLSREEIYRLAEAAACQMHRALILACFETCARKSEITRLKIEDLQINGEYAKAYVPLSKSRVKGQKRTLLFIHSFPEVVKWVQQHPTGKGILFRRRVRDVPLDPVTLNNSLRAAAARAGINKPISLHRLRHSGITYSLQQGMTEAEISRKVGYAKGSDMVSKVYGHLSTGDVEQRELMLAGMAPAEVKVEELQKCPRCLMPNTPGAGYCVRCREPLTLETRKAVEETQGGETQAIWEQVQELNKGWAKAQHQIDKLVSAMSRYTGMSPEEFKEQARVMVRERMRKAKGT